MGRRARLVTKARVLLAALALLGAGSVRAQVPAVRGHGRVPPADRPLHERLERARYVGFATVARVEAGRIAFEDPRAVIGTLGGAFQVKRAPSRSPPVAVGDRVLLLLRGARSPYVWVERPAEVVVAEDAAAEARWSEALRRLDAVRTDAVARRDLYASWVDAGPEPLREAALRALLDPGLPASVADPAFVEGRLAVVRDPARPRAARRAAARVAARHPEGVAGLLDHLARVGPDADPEIARVALRIALLVGMEGAEALLLDLMTGTPDALRQEAVRLARLARSEAVEEELARVAAADADDAIRKEAVNSLEAIRRREGREGR